MSFYCPNCRKTIDTRDSALLDLCPDCGYIDDQTATDFGQTHSKSDSLNESGSQLDDRPQTTTSPIDEWVGREIGDYSIVSKLGQGGMGLVLLAVQKSAQRKVALKIIRADRMYDHDATRAEESIARFKSEAMATAQLEHENIITVYEVGQFEGHHYFSMQFVKGQSLSQICKKRQLSPKEMARFIVPICRALQHAHSHGILHRDIKPGNIMIDEEGRPFLTDFGLAKWFEDDDHSLTRSGQVFGTATYMSPQQAIDASQSTISCDVYSLGATIYRLITGRSPFDKGSLVEVLRQVIDQPPTPPRSISQAIDADTETIVLKCLEKEPGKRYRTADELGDELQRVLDGRPILARPVTSGERFWRWCKRNPLVAGLATSALIFLMATVFAFTLNYISVSRAYEQNRNYLRNSLLNQAIEMQSSTRAGRRKRALEALSEAAKIRPGLDLRNLYARYLDQPDIQLMHEITIPDWNTNGLGYADGIADSDRVIAVADGGKPIEIDTRTSVVRDIKELGPFRRDFERESTFLAKISPNGKYLAGNSPEAGAIEIWDLTTLQKLGELKNEDGIPLQIESLAFDPQGTCIYCAGGDAQSETQSWFYRFALPELTLQENWVEDARSVDGLRIIDDGFLFARLLTDVTQVKVWKQAQGSKETPPETSKLRLDERSMEVFDRVIAFDREFKRIYYGKASGSFSAREFPSGNPLDEALLGRHTKSITAADISPDGLWMISCGRDRKLNIWDKLSGNIVAAIDIDSDRAVNAQWLHGSKTLLVDSNKGLQIWKFLEPSFTQFFVKDELGQPQLGVTPYSLKFDSQEKSLFNSCDRFLSRLDLSNLEEGFALLPNENKNRFEVFVSQDGTQYATYGSYFQNERPLYIYSVDSPQANLTIEKPANVKFVDLSQTFDGRFIISQFTNDKILTVKPLSSDGVIFKYELQNGDDVRALVADNGEKIAVLSKKTATLDIFDFKTGEMIFSEAADWSNPGITSNGSRVIFRDDSELLVVDVETQKRVNKRPIEANSSGSFEISGDGRYAVVMVETDRRIDLYNMEAEGELELSLDFGLSAPKRIAISKTGKWLAVCDVQGAVKIWNVNRLFSDLRKGGVLPDSN